MFSRHPLEPREQPTGLAEFDYRYQAVGVPACDLELRAMYAPAHKVHPFDRFWTATLDALERERSLPVLVVGDFNSGIGLDSEADRIFCQEYFKQLSHRGLVDLWRAMHGDAVEFTWRGHKNGYRLDHAFGTQAVRDRLQSCVYDHAVRENKLSDHSLLSVDVSSREVLAARASSSPASRTSLPGSSSAELGHSPGAMTPSIRQTSLARE